MSLSSLLVQSEVASIRQVEEALARQVIYGGDLVTNLLEVGRFDEARLAGLVAGSFELAAAPSGPLPTPEDHVKSLVPRSLALLVNMVPLYFEGDHLVVAVSEPLAPKIANELSASASTPIEQRVALHVRLREALTQIYGQPIERRIHRILLRMNAPAGSPSTVPPPSEPIPGSTALSFGPDLADGRGRTAVPPPDSTTLPEPGAQAPAAAGGAPVAAGSPFRAAGSAAAVPAIVQGLQRRHTSMGLSAVAAPSSASPSPGAGEVAGASAEGARGLVRREPPAPRPPRKRRGPMTLEMAMKELDEVDARDAVLDLLFDFSRQFFDYIALFVVQGDMAEGREAHGAGASRDRVAGMGVPLDFPSLFSTARDRKAAVLAMPAKDGLDAVLLNDLQRPVGPQVAVLPVAVRGRAVALVYADNGDAGVDFDAVSDVLAFAAATGPALEQLILRKKLGGAPGDGGKRGATSASERAPAKRAAAPKIRPSAVLASLATPLVALDPALADPTDRPPANEPETPPDSLSFGANDNPPVVSPSLSHSQSPRSPLAVSSPAIARASQPPERNSVPPAPPYAGHAPESPVPPPPPTAAALRRHVGPPIPREEPPDSGDAAARALLEDIARKPDSDVGPRPDPYVPPSSPPSDMAIAIAPHRPPSSHSEPVVGLPSVIIDGDDENRDLVETLVVRGGDETIEAELVRRGHHAMPSLMEVFPGPILADRARNSDALLRIADAGPIVRVIAAQRRIALPFVLGHMEDSDAERRFWATLLITELPYPEAIPALLPRLLDDEARIRRAAVQAVRAIYRATPGPIVDALARVGTDTTQPTAKRIAMLDALVDARASGAVPVLIDVLGDTDRNVAVAACNGLALITHQDFVLDVAAWRGWWAENAGRHRLEWLIDALMHESTDVRRDAAVELRSLTREYFGYSEDLPDRERARAQQRWRDWWLTEGKTRFARQ